MTIYNLNSIASQNESFLDSELEEIDLSPIKKWSDELKILIDTTFFLSSADIPVQNRTAIYPYGELLDQNPNLPDFNYSESDAAIQSLFIWAIDSINKKKTKYDQFYLNLKLVLRAIEPSIEGLEVLDRVSRKLSRIECEEDLNENGELRAKAQSNSEELKLLLESQRDFFQRVQATFSKDRATFHSLLSRCEQINESLPENVNDDYKTFYTAYAHILTLSCSYTTIALSKIGVLEHAMIRSLKLLKPLNTIIRNNPTINR